MELQILIDLIINVQVVDSRLIFCLTLLDPLFNCTVLGTLTRVRERLRQCALNPLLQLALVVLCSIFRSPLIFGRPML